MKQTVYFLVIISMLFVGCAGKTELDSNRESKKTDGYVFTEYSNEIIGINLRYPSDWHIFDDQKKINDAGLAPLRAEIENVFILLITPSKTIPNLKELEKLNQPITMLQVMPLPVEGTKSFKNLINEAINYEISVMKKQDSTTSIIDGPRTIDINGKEWIIYSTAMEGQNVFNVSSSYMNTGGKWYKFTAMCKLDKKEQYKDYFNQIIKSVKLVKN